MTKQFKSVSLMLCLLAMSTGSAMATTSAAPISAPVVQQSETATGTVVDAMGPVIGASVVVKGTTNGVITDFDGNFSLSNVKKGDIIQISFMGYSTQEVTWNGAPLKVTLKEDAQQLEEVVVTGYGGKQLRSKVTSSITKVDNTAITSGVKANPVSALAGSVAGLSVQQNSGKPGSMPTVVLRGGTSLSGGGSPLYVIDGVVRTISDFNPEDIESMEVLKDASATAIYGARANNGVILITTKKGKSGKAQINFKSKTSLGFMGYMPEFLDAGNYLHYQRMGIYNAANTGTTYAAAWESLLTQANGFGTGNLLYDPANPTQFLDGNKDARAIYSTMKLTDENRFLLAQGWQTMKDPVYGDDLIYKSFDFSNEAFRDMAITQDYNINVSGGNDKGHYYAGLGYYDEKGFPANTWYKRMNFTLNADYKITEWLTSYSSFNFAEAKWREATNMNQTTAEYFGRMLSVPPTMRGYNMDGELLMGVHSKDGNPNFNQDKFIRRNQSDKFSFSQTLQFDITKNLYLKLVGNVFFSETFNEAFNKDYMERPNSINKTRESSAAFDRSITQTYNAIAGWNQSFGKHNIDALVGAELYDYKNIGLKANGRGAATDDFMDLGLTSSAANARGIDTYHYRERYQSYFGKVNYDFDGKYLFSFTYRADGSSKLINNRWGFFPGVSAGWNLMKESFMDDYKDFISFLKIRAGYGQNGNISGLSYYTAQGSLGSNGKYNGNLGYKVSGLALPDLLWEKSTTFDAAVDVSFMENKYNLSVGYFNRLTSDLFANITMPATGGWSSILSNNGKVRNKGLEIEASVNILNNKDWTWKVGGNISYVKSIVEKLPTNSLDKNRQGGQEIYTGRKLEDGSYETVVVGGTAEGERYGQMYGYIFEGLYSEADLDANKCISVDKTTSNGYTYSPAEYAKLSADQQKKNHVLQPGDAKWKDINGDGMIDSKDQAYLGNSVPTWTGGFNSTVTWKNFSLYAKFDFALGHTVFDSLRQGFLSNNQGEFNTTTDVFDTWSDTNTAAKYPRYTRADGLLKNNYRYSSLLAYKGDYLCVRDVTLSYNVPANLLSKINISGLQLSVTGQNLLYLKSDIYTPEGRGNAGSAYPLPVQVVFGANLTF